MPEAQGQRANMTGKNLERFISGLLDHAGYTCIDAVAFMATRTKGLPIYAREYPVGKDLYDRAHKCDFILFHPDKYPHCLVIESKWQQASGSVEEKLPFLVLSIEQSGYDTFVVMDGGGYSPGAEAWLRRQTGKNTRLQQVFDMQQFQRFANDGRL